ncbi:MAG: ribosome silencing factor [Burkholderiales bacterium]|nr:ribosome silencing factor [Burkholderiales bacterium]
MTERPAAETLTRAVVAALEDIKARDIAVLDVRKLTSLFDTVVVASGDSPRQTKALARSVHDKVKEAGGSILGVEGEDTGEWVLVDCVDVVVHVMQPAVRAHYNLEELWGGTRPLPRGASVHRLPAGAFANAAEPATAAADPAG